MTGPAKSRSRASEYDVVVAGFGAAGACAAIQAADEGAGVLVIDRFSGGGATAMSGGVIYAGSGTRAQKSAGFRDGVELMHGYLRRETGGAVTPKELKHFCKTSRENIMWLEQNGLSFPDKFYKQKTTQPPAGYGLYYSGNEMQYSGKNAVARGHVPSGGGMMTGPVLYEALKKAAAERGVDVRTHCMLEMITTDGSGAATGIIAREIRNPLLKKIHGLLYWLGFAGSAGTGMIRAFEKIAGRRVTILAKGGVVIASGGFIFNGSMMKRFAPKFRGTMRLGTPGDDGAGIAAGMKAGASVDSMDSCAASRFYCPPQAFASGILVNSDGKRVCDESLYGATLSSAIAVQPGGRAYLVVDSRIMETAREQMKAEERIRDHPLREIFSGELNALIFRRAMAFVNMKLNRKMAGSIEELEKKCGMPAGGLSSTVSSYNSSSASGKDGFGKRRDFLAQISRPPFYAIDCRISNRIFPAPCITLGGLKTDRLTGAVLGRGGSPIKGLYAAGRSAAGICASSYVSGLSLADCIYSGRNAGRSAARSAGAGTGKPKKRKA
ncbi:MAG: FAD-binding protein [Spirochaetes bacterium]|jgi:3-oxo-5alpha-steroid 4-dehydrogenase|nr:FAD-binding protein [Spirochaetota bacterium]